MVSIHYKGDNFLEEDLKKKHYACEIIKIHCLSQKKVTCFFCHGMVDWRKESQKRNTIRLFLKSLKISYHLCLSYLLSLWSWYDFIWSHFTSTVLEIHLLSLNSPVPPSSSWLQLPNVSFWLNLSQTIHYQSISLHNLGGAKVTYHLKMNNLESENGEHLRDNVFPN